MSLSGLISLSYSASFFFHSLYRFVFHFPFFHPDSSFFPINLICSIISFPVLQPLHFPTTLCITCWPLIIPSAWCSQEGFFFFYWTISGWCNCSGDFLWSILLTYYNEWLVCLYPSHLTLPTSHSHSLSLSLSLYHICVCVCVFVCAKRKETSRTHQYWNGQKSPYLSFFF